MTEATDIAATVARPSRARSRALARFVRHRLALFFFFFKQKTAYEI